MSAPTSRTAAIERFADTIQEIADQTNLLALNATVEAARATSGADLPSWRAR